MRKCNFSFQKMGDLNHDGVIDDNDTGLLLKHWGTKKGDRGYKPKYDLNGDGIIDVLDLHPIICNYGMRMVESAGFILLYREEIAPSPSP